MLLPIPLAVALTTLLTLAAETGLARFKMLISGILLLMPGSALINWSALCYAPAAAWPEWLTHSVPLLLLLLLLLTLLGVLTLIPVAAGHILDPPGLLIYWLSAWWLGRVWFRNFLTEYTTYFHVATHHL